MANSAVGTCTITRLHTGDSLYITFNVSGQTCVFYDDNGLITKFSSSNPLVVTPVISSQKGATVTISSVSWTVNGGSIASYGKVSDGKTAIDGTVYDKGTLVLNTSTPYDYKNPQSHVFTMKATVVVNGYTQDVSKSFEVTMAKNVSNSYWGTVHTNRTQIDSSNTTATLTQELSLGGTKLTSGYTVKWFKNGSTTAFSTDTSVTVGRSDVDGAAVFTCRFYVNNVEVEADGLTIVDLDDELKVICPDEVQVAYGNTASITPTLCKTTIDSTTQKASSATVSCTNWSVLVQNNYTMATVSSSDYSFTASTGAFSMAESKMYYTPVSGDANYDSNNPDATHEYNPIVTFTATI